MAVEYKDYSLILEEKVSADSLGLNLDLLLVDEEEVLLAYKSSKEFVVFTNKRVLARKRHVDHSVETHTIPYKSIDIFSIKYRSLRDKGIHTIEFRTTTGEVSMDFRNDVELDLINKIVTSAIL